MTEPQGALLPGECDVARRWKPGVQLVEQLAAAAALQRRLELEGHIEMILDRVLGPAGDKVELLDAGRLGLLHCVMDQRLVDDGQHLLGHRLRRRQRARTQSGYREYRLADALSHSDPPRGPPLADCGLPD